MESGKWLVIIKILTAAMVMLLPISMDGQVTRIRSVSVLPTTCVGGSAVQSTDKVILVASTTGFGTEYTCIAPNIWAAQSGLITNGLIAEYRLMEGSGASILDYSGHNNTGVFGVGGNAPSWIANTGGLLFSGGQFVTLPAALSNPGTVMLFFAVTNAVNNSNPVALLGDTVAASSLIWLNKSGNTAAGANSYVALDGGYRLMTDSNPNGGIRTVTKAIPQGTLVLTFVYGTGANSDAVYINGLPLASTSFYLNPGTANLNTCVGACWQLGGTIGAGFFNGTIYYAAFYNRQLAVNEVAQNSQVIIQVMAGRGILLSSGTVPGDTQNMLVADGDSITVGFNGLVPYTSTPLNLSKDPQLNTAFLVANTAKSGARLGLNDLVANAKFQVDPLYHAGASRNAVIVWAGTNEGGNVGGLAQYCKDRQKAGWKCIVATMVSRTGLDATKNAYDTSIRTLWPSFADAFADIAADPNLGADGASASATFFQDGIHPTQGSIYNDEVPIFERAVNRLYGNHDFTIANTYTTAAPAATAITASTESGNTVTITSTLNPPIGSTVTIAGVTPAGYNGNFTVLTTAAGSFTYYNFTTGLGAGTIFGTAKIPQQVDEDVYVNLGGSAAGNPAFTMQSCVGYTGQNLYIKNSNTTSAWVLTPFGSETIDGAAMLTMPIASSGNNPMVILQSVLVSSAAGGCNWRRVQ